MYASVGRRPAVGRAAGRGPGRRAVVLLYLRACAWADWDLMSSRVRRRAHAWERRAPAFSAGAGVVAGIGLVLVLLDGFT